MLLHNTVCSYRRCWYWFICWTAK